MLVVIEKEIMENNKNLFDVIVILWKERVLIISVVLLSVICSIFYIFVVDKTYKVSTTLLFTYPSEETTVVPTSSILSGVNIFSSNESMIQQQAITIIESEDFLLKMYKKYGNNPLLFEDNIQKITENNKLTKLEKEENKKEVAIKLLRDLISYKIAGNDLLQISIVLKNKYFAVEFLEDIVVFLKNTLLELNQRILKNSIKYYDQTAAKVENPIIKKKLDEIRNEKLKRSYLLSTNAFIILDKPRVPFKKYSPKRIVIITIAFALSFLMSIFIIYYKYKLFSLIKYFKKNR